MLNRRPPGGGDWRHATLNGECSSVRRALTMQQSNRDKGDGTPCDDERFSFSGIRLALSASDSHAQRLTHHRGELGVPDEKDWGVSRDNGSMWKRQTGWLQHALSPEVIMSSAHLTLRCRDGLDVCGILWSAKYESRSELDLNPKRGDALISDNSLVARRAKRLISESRGSSAANAG